MANILQNKELKRVKDAQRKQDDFNVSTAYIIRSLGIVNACDPIVSTGLSESILKNKKETSRQKKYIM